MPSRKKSSDNKNANAAKQKWDSARETVETWAARTKSEILNDDNAAEALQKLLRWGCDGESMVLVLDLISIYTDGRSDDLRDRRKGWRDRQKNLALRLRSVARDVQKFEADVLGIEPSSEPEADINPAPRNQENNDSDFDGEPQVPEKPTVVIRANVLRALQPTLLPSPTPSLVAMMFEEADNIEAFLEMTADRDMFPDVLDRNFGGSLPALVFAERILQEKTGSARYAQLGTLIQAISPVRVISDNGLGRKIRRFLKRNQRATRTWMSGSDLEKNARLLVNNWRRAVSDLQQERKARVIWRAKKRSSKSRSEND